MSALQEAAGGEERSGEDTDERRYFKQVQELRAKNETQESGSGGGNTSSDNIAAECEAEAVDEDTDGNSITALAFDALGHYLAGGTKNAVSGDSTDRELDRRRCDCNTTGTEKEENK